MKRVNDVGVVIRTRNRPAFLHRSLASLLSQSHPDWKAVIVNDGGDVEAIDAVLSSPTIVPASMRARIATLSHAATKGRGAAFNAGLGVLKTRFCACLDDDDTWDDKFLARMTAGYERLLGAWPFLGAACGELIDVYERANRRPDTEKSGLVLEEIKRIKEPSYNEMGPLISPYRYLKRSQNCLPVQLLFDRVKLTEFGGFDESYEVLEDRSALTRFLLSYQIGVVPNAVAYHHIRVDEPPDSALRNAMGDNLGYDWQCHFRSIESSLFYRGTPAERVTLPKLMFLLSEMEDSINRRAVQSSGIKRLANSSSRRKIGIAIAAAALLVLVIILNALLTVFFLKI